MLIPLKNLVKIWNIHPSGVLHVGPHLAEESSDYDHFEWGYEHGIHWVEAQKELADRLMKKFTGTRNTIYEGVVWHTSNEILTFNTSNNSQSSSVYQFGTHSKDYPEVIFQSEHKVSTITISDLIPSSVKFDFINLDIQGAELNALKGLGDRLSEVKWIYTEVNSREVYKGCATITEIDEFLGMNGFLRVSTAWVKEAGWGDALYVRDSILSNKVLTNLKAFQDLALRMVEKNMRRVKKLLKMIMHQLRR